MSQQVSEFDRTMIEEQAREWLIRMDGDDVLTDAQKYALNEWLRRSPLHGQELTRVAKVWVQANVLTELAMPLGPGPVSEVSASSKLTKPLLYLAATAVLAAVVLTGSLVRWSDLLVNGTYVTERGQERSVRLPDGSSVQLNTDTRIRIAYSAHSRVILLLRGEALFSVAPDVGRPFEVDAATSVVRALGTAFAVRLDSTAVSVVVTSGTVGVSETSVDVSPDGQPSKQEVSKQEPKLRPLGELKAGQTAIVDHETARLTVQPIARKDLERQLAWRDGFLVFSGQPLKEVVEEINRYSPVTLQITDPKLESVAVGGRFRIGNLDAVLDALRDNFGVDVVRLDEHNVRLKRAGSSEAPLGTR